MRRFENARSTLECRLDEMRFILIGCGSFALNDWARTVDDIFHVLDSLIVSIVCDNIGNSDKREAEA